MEHPVTLFLCFANEDSEPIGETDNYLDALKDEETGIGKSLDSLRNEGKCKVLREPNTTPEQFFSTLQKNRDSINIIHFSGHASDKSIQLEAPDGQPHHISLENTLPFLKNQKELKFVFLNGCNTSTQAQFLVSENIPVTIGTTDEIDQDDSALFATEFYNSLATGATLQEAFEEAKSYLISMTDATYAASFPFELCSINEESKGWCAFPKAKSNKQKKQSKKIKLKILQLSDFRLTEKSDSKKIEKLNQTLNDGEIDLILFTGNLNETDYTESYQESYNNSLKQLGQLIGVDEKNIITCAGDCEYDSSKAIKPISKELHSFKDNESLTSYLHLNQEEFNLSCNPLNNYNLLVEEKFREVEEDVTNKLVTSHIRQFQDIKIGITTINIFWSGKDYDKLVFPLEGLQNATGRLTGVDFKIIVCNTDFRTLKLFNRKEIKSHVLKYYDMAFHGRKSSSSKNDSLTTNEGIFSSYSGFSETNEIDFVVHTLDIPSKNIKENRYIYTKEGANEITKIKNNLIVPHGNIKERQLKLIHTLDNWHQKYNELGDDLFVNYRDKDKGFMDLFTTPVIREKPADEFQSVDKNIKVTRNLFEKIKKSKDNYMILGKDKSGKSSLLINLAIRFSHHFEKEGIIPIYFNLEDNKFGNPKVDLLTFISRHLECSKSFAKQLLEKYHVRLLLDNFDPNNRIILEKLADFLDTYSCSYIICSDQTTLRSYDKFDFGFNDYTKLFIHDITRTEIRSLVKKSTGESDEYVEDVVQKIVKVFRQHKMPFNFWTVSVFLWIISKTGKDDIMIQNNSQLIELYIQELLGQHELAHSNRNKFPYKKFRKFLSYLAYRLYKDYEDKTYSVSYSDLVNITEEFLSKSRRNVASTEYVINYIFSKGILKKKGEEYTFRLNGVFEYFLANQMLEDNNFLKEILLDNSKYLSFKNEIDLYSGFERRDTTKDKDFLEMIWAKTQKAFEQANTKYIKVGTPDEVLVKLQVHSPALKALSDLSVQKIEPLPYEKKDELNNIMDIEERLGNEEEFSGEVKLKRPFDKNANTIEALEVYLFIMARVFRNIEVEDSDSDDLDRRLFSFILDSSCNYGFLLLENLASHINEPDNKTSEDEFFIPKNLLKLMTSFVPVIIQDTLHEALGHVTLENIIKLKIKELEEDASNNQFKLFILYFCLIDLDVYGNRNYIDKAIEISKINSIQYSIILKLLFYLIFKSYDKPELKSYLKEKYRAIQFKVNPKLDIDKLNKSISDIEKNALIVKRQERK